MTPGKPATVLIDLRKIPTRIIACPDNAPRRHKNVTAMARRLGLNYEVHRPIYTGGEKFIGCALAHLRTLTGAQAPCLVLEDDCEATPDFRPRLEVPDEADAVHLGMCIFGIPLSDHPPPRLTIAVPGRCPGETRRVPRHLFDGVVTSEYDGTFLRAHNMLDGHAYLYLKDEVIAKVREEIVGALAIPWHWDVAMARLQKQQLLVLTLRRPFFFQKGGACPPPGETAPMPVANPDELDDAWFERLLDRELSRRRLVPRLCEYARVKLRRGLEYLVRKLA